MNAIQVTRTVLTAVAAAALTLLAACGGGGGGSSEDTPIVETPTAPELIIPAGVTVTYPAGSAASLALQTVNTMISHCGYSRMNSVRDLTHAAQGHMDYIAANGFHYSHLQESGKPGFTGATHVERIVAAGGAAERANHSSEGVGGMGGSHGRVTTGLLAAPYHQADLLSQFSEIGIGTAEDPDLALLDPSVTAESVVFNYGGTKLNSVPLNDVRTFPCEGSTLIPSQGGPETPDPAPELAGKFGPGLNFETNKDGAIEVTSISLRNLANGNVIPLQPVKGHSLEGVEWRSVWISKGYLSPKTTYRVEARGNTYATKKMTGSATAWSKSFSFTTF